MVDLKIIPNSEFQRVQNAKIDIYEETAILADMCRVNTLVAVKRAGSGHLGSSFSAIDIVTWLYTHELNIQKVGLASPDRDIYFSSKGHDVPGLYSVLHSLGLLDENRLLKLRRLGGLDGHPDVGIPGIESNTGSLGMGISKGRGMAWAKKYLKRQGRVYVMTGDGELQEGQNFEALQSAAHQKLDNLTVIVDHNKVQTDKLIHEILDIGDLEEKFTVFGWHVARCNGHDFREIEQNLSEFKRITGKPQVLIADTIKGKGVSFMEHPLALEIGKGLYPWHSGAPDDKSFLKGHAALMENINKKLENKNIPPIVLKEVQIETFSEPHVSLHGEPLSQAIQEKIKAKVTDEYVSQVYGKTLLEIGSKRNDIVVLDADLASDCKIRDFEDKYPQRFIQSGIAEQDMVSMAGGLARQGLLPIVNSFASFLASRANEQIYNNASENTKIIYALHYAGLIPAGPGKSHQSIRDISVLNSIPNIIILQPCNGDETRMVVEYCTEQAEENCAIRLIIGPSPRRIQLPKDYQLTFGKGVELNDGDKAILFSYGPVMLHEALLASEILSEKGFNLKVINMPWLNRIDTDWFQEVIKDFKALFVLEDHASVGGLGDYLMSVLSRTNLFNNHQIIKFAIDGYPSFGTPPEVLRNHSLDGESLSIRILDYMGLLERN